MSLYVLDTDTLTLWRERHPNVARQVAARARSDLAITVISVEEQLSGWYRVLRRARRRDQLARVYDRLARSVEFLSGLPILDFTVSAILRYEHLHTLRLNVGLMDLRIASIALEHGGTVVTRNVRDFGRVPGLTVED